MNTTMKTPFLDLSYQHRPLAKELAEAFSRVLQTERYILSEQVALLENEMAHYIGCRYAVGVASGSDALELSLQAIKFKPQDEIITTPFTFGATATAIMRSGAKLRFADISSENFNLNPCAVADAITPRTRGILVVHLFGVPCLMEEFFKLAHEAKASLVEDCAQSTGAEYHGKKLGSFGALSCFSFYPTKNLGGFGDGGMVLTHSQPLFNRIRLLRNHGESPRYYQTSLGRNSRLDEIQAALLRVKLKFLERWNQERRDLAKVYRTALANLVDRGFIRLPTLPQGAIPSLSAFVVTAKNRNKLRQRLDQHGIPTQVYYPYPLHVQPIYRYLNLKKGDFPIAEKTAQSILALPFYPGLAEMQVDYIVSHMEKFYLAPSGKLRRG